MRAMRATLAAICLALAAAGSAEADPRHTARFPQFGGIYREEAQRTFGAAPLCRVRHIRIPQGEINATHGGHIAADASPATCTIRYGAEWWDRASPRWRCVAMVHEYGHLLGLDHSADPHSVMSAPPALWSACRTVNVVRLGWRSTAAMHPAVAVWARTPFETLNGYDDRRPPGEWILSRSPSSSTTACAPSRSRCPRTP